MPERLRYDRHVHRGHESQRSPGVARHVRRERLVYPRQLSQSFQRLVIIGELAFVLPVRRIFVLRSKKREHIVAAVRPVTVDYLLHARLQLDLHHLVGLTPVIHKHATLYLRFLQESHIHKRHAAGIEAEQEHIAHQLHKRTGLHLHGTQLVDIRLLYRTFPGAGNARKHIAERFFLLRKPLLHRLVVDSTQRAHVARQGVLAYPLSPEPFPVSVYQPAIHLGKGDVLFAMKRKERTERSGIIVRRTVAVHETGARNLLADKPGETAGNGGRLFLFPFPARRAAVAPDTYLEYNTDFKHDFSF